MKRLLHRWITAFICSTLMVNPSTGFAGTANTKLAAQSMTREGEKALANEILSAYLYRPLARKLFAAGKSLASKGSPATPENFLLELQEQLLASVDPEDQLKLEKPPQSPAYGVRFLVRLGPDLEVPIRISTEAQGVKIRFVEQKWYWKKFFSPPIGYLSVQVMVGDEPLVFLYYNKDDALDLHPEEKTELEKLQKCCLVRPPEEVDTKEKILMQVYRLKPDYKDMDPVEILKNIGVPPSVAAQEVARYRSGANMVFTGITGLVAFIVVGCQGGGGGGIPAGSISGGQIPQPPATVSVISLPASNIGTSFDHGVSVGGQLVGPVIDERVDTHRQHTVSFPSLSGSPATTPPARALLVPLANFTGASEVINPASAKVAVSTDERVVSVLLPALSQDGSLGSFSVAVFGSKEGGRVLRTFPTEPISYRDVAGVVMTPSGSHVIVGLTRGTVKIYNVQTGEVQDVDFGGRLAELGIQTRAIGLDVSGGRVRLNIRGNPGNVPIVPGGPEFVAQADLTPLLAGFEQTPAIPLRDPRKTFDLGNGTTVKVYEIPEAPEYMHVQVSKDGTVISEADVIPGAPANAQEMSVDNVRTILKIRINGEIKELPLVEVPPVPVPVPAGTPIPVPFTGTSVPLVSADGTIGVTFGALQNPNGVPFNDSYVEIFINGSKRFTVSAYNSNPYFPNQMSAYLSPDGKRLVVLSQRRSSGTRDGHEIPLSDLYLFDLENNKSLGDFEIADTQNFTVNADGKILVRDRTGNLRLIDIRTAEHPVVELAPQIKIPGVGSVTFEVFTTGTANAIIRGQDNKPIGSPINFPLGSHVGINEGHFVAGQSRPPYLAILSPDGKLLRHFLITGPDSPTEIIAQAVHLESSSSDGQYQAHLGSYSSGKENDIVTGYQYVAITKPGDASFLAWDFFSGLPYASGIFSPDNKYFIFVSDRRSEKGGSFYLNVLNTSGNGPAHQIRLDMGSSDGNQPWTFNQVQGDILTVSAGLSGVAQTINLATGVLTALPALETRIPLPTGFSPGAYVAYGPKYPGIIKVELNPISTSAEDSGIGFTVPYFGTGPISVEVDPRGKAYLRIVSGDENLVVKTDAYTGGNYFLLVERKIKIPGGGYVITGGNRHYVPHTKIVLADGSSFELESSVDFPEDGYGNMVDKVERVEGYDNIIRLWQGKESRLVDLANRRVLATLPPALIQGTPLVDTTRLQSADGSVVVTFSRVGTDTQHYYFRRVANISRNGADVPRNIDIASSVENAWAWLTPDGKRLVTLGENYTYSEFPSRTGEPYVVYRLLHIFNLEKGTEIIPDGIKVNDASGFTIEDGNTIVVDDEGIVRKFDLATGKEKLVMPAPTNTLALPGGGYFGIMPVTRAVRLFVPVPGSATGDIRTFEVSIAGVNWSPGIDVANTGVKIEAVSGHPDWIKITTATGVSKTFDLTTGEEVPVPTVVSIGEMEPTTLPAGRYTAATVGDNVELKNATGEVVARIPKERAALEMYGTGLAFLTADGKNIWVIRLDKPELMPAKIPAFGQGALSFSVIGLPSGGVLPTQVAIGRGSETRFVDIQTGRVVIPQADVSIDDRGYSAGGWIKQVGVDSYQLTWQGTSMGRGAVYMLTIPGEGEVRFERLERDVQPQAGGGELVIDMAIHLSRGGKPVTFDFQSGMIVTLPDGAIMTPEGRFAAVIEAGTLKLLNARTGAVVASKPGFDGATLELTDYGGDALSVRRTSARDILVETSGGGRVTEAPTTGISYQPVEEIFAAIFAGDQPVGQLGGNDIYLSSQEINVPGQKPYHETGVFVFKHGGKTEGGVRGYLIGKPIKTQIVGDWLVVLASKEENLPAYPTNRIHVLDKNGREIEFPSEYFGTSVGDAMEFRVDGNKIIVGNRTIELGLLTPPSGSPTPPSAQKTGISRATAPMLPGPEPVLRAVLVSNTATAEIAAEADAFRKQLPEGMYDNYLKSIQGGLRTSAGVFGDGKYVSLKERFKPYHIPALRWHFLSMLTNPGNQHTLSDIRKLHKDGIITRDEANSVAVMMQVQALQQGSLAAIKAVFKGLYDPSDEGPVGIKLPRTLIIELLGSNPNLWKRDIEEDLVNSHVITDEEARLILANPYREPIVQWQMRVALAKGRAKVDAEWDVLQAAKEQRQLREILFGVQGDLKAYGLKSGYENAPATGRSTGKRSVEPQEPIEKSSAPRFKSSRLSNGLLFLALAHLAAPAAMTESRAVEAAPMVGPSADTVGQAEARKLLLSMSQGPETLEEQRAADAVVADAKREIEQKRQMEAVWGPGELDRFQTTLKDYGKVLVDLSTMPGKRALSEMVGLTEQVERNKKTLKIMSILVNANIRLKTRLDRGEIAAQDYAKALNSLGILTTEASLKALDRLTTRLDRNEITVKDYAAALKNLSMLKGQEALNALDHLSTGLDRGEMGVRQFLKAVKDLAPMRRGALPVGPGEAGVIGLDLDGIVVVNKAL